jgi:PPP family 3-phenylpropionic acid transporter
MTINNSFLILHLNDLGAGKSLIGLALSFSILGELPIFYFADHLLTRWGTRRMLTFAMWMYVIRNLAYSLMRAPWLALPIQMLNGPSFSVKWVAAVSYTNEISPTGMGATGQGLLGATMMGIGGTFGSLLGGFLYDAVGGATLFLWIAIGVTFGTLVFMLAGKEALQKGVA